MQNDELHNWYKTSFEGIESKPVPDIWDAIANEIPDVSRSSWQPKLVYLLLPIIVVGSLLFIGSNGNKDYSPRENAYTATSLIAFNSEKKEISNQNTPSQNENQSTTSAPTQKVILHSTTTGPIAIASKTKASFSTPRSADLINSGIDLSYASILNPSRFHWNKNDIANISEKNIEVSTVNLSNYAAFAINLCNVTMFNSAFQKATNKESLTANALFIKPAYSLLFGRRINNNVFLELSISSLNLGQSISAYHEGTFGTTNKELNYISVGLGVLKYSPSIKTISPYYGASVSCRYLLKSDGFEAQSISNQDYAFGLKGGGKYNLSELLSFRLGVAGSCSITNLSTNGHLSKNQIKSSRNFAAGLELSVIKSF